MINKGQWLYFMIIIIFIHKESHISNYGTKYIIKLKIRLYTIINLSLNFNGDLKLYIIVIIYEACRTMGLHY